MPNEVTIISNEIIQSLVSNLEALGIYAYLCSFPISISYHQIRTHFNLSFYHLNKAIDYLCHKKLIKIIPTLSLKKSDYLIQLV